MWNDIYDDKNPWSHGYILEFGYYSNPNNPDRMETVMTTVRKSLQKQTQTIL